MFDYNNTFVSDAKTKTEKEFYDKHKDVLLKFSKKFAIYIRNRNIFFKLCFNEKKEATLKLIFDNIYDEYDITDIKLKEQKYKQKNHLNFLIGETCEIHNVTSIILENNKNLFKIIMLNIFDDIINKHEVKKEKMRNIIDENDYHKLNGETFFAEKLITESFRDLPYDVAKQIFIKIISVNENKREALKSIQDKDIYNKLSEEIMDNDFFISNSFKAANLPLHLQEEVLIGAYGEDMYKNMIKQINNNISNCKKDNYINK